MYPRQARIAVDRLARGFPVLALTGPRQSGKTTLARATFSDKPYVSLENPDERDFAEQDPKRFLARFPEGAILDEVQRCPALLSWLQGLVDERQVMGQFVLTGSAQFDLIAGMSQSLAGRVGRVELLPLSLAEMQAGACLPSSLDRLLLKGSYPAIYQRDLSANDWFPNYVATYLERDVRQIIAVRDLSQFQRFVRMCAARSGQLLNLAALGADCGISAVTAREWLSVLEASYLVTRLPPYFQNFGKRLVKSPKLYFLDVGLMAWLLGIRDEESMATHAARGALFETWVVSELIKQRFNAGQPADLYFWRDSAGHEIDVVYETAAGLQAVEIKSGSTFAADWVDGLKKWQKFTGDTPTVKPILIYGGADSHERELCFLTGWQDMARR
ncbi:ATP-binding protein [Dechloromonas sp.]|uniref:ATP-binding protein n=1 Tax=Dechloromonas sp. TaxID=1917218 RepID=UPI0012024951|nr:ATP-binding protein [Dechloromonas sp.]MBU3697482.1 ATP-binding protein [Dechloromonas sp.]TEX44587.1 MAG: AAA family ATPase [Rhodocyclaceae bacterium]